MESKPAKRSSLTLRVAIVLLLTVIVTAGNVATALLLGHLGHSAETNKVVGALLLLGAFVGLPLLLIVGVATAVFSPFDGELPRMNRVIMVLLGYGSTIVMYSAVYFDLAALGDHDQAVSNNVIFRYHPQYLDGSTEVTREELLKWTFDTRSFKGINDSLYLSIDQEAPSELSRRYLSGTEITRLAQDPNEQRPRKNVAAAFPIWLDCLHLSVVTAATVGYGDIVPISHRAKLATDSQILVSTAILVFGFGLIVSGGEGNRVNA